LLFFLFYLFSLIVFSVLSLSLDTSDTIGRGRYSTLPPDWKSPHGESRRGDASPSVSPFLGGIAQKWEA
jgi:hypothetical protein